MPNENRELLYNELDIDVNKKLEDEIYKLLKIDTVYRLNRKIKENKAIEFKVIQKILKRFKS